MNKKHKFIATRLAATRAAKGYTQQSLAEALGVHLRSIQTWESPEGAGPKPGTLRTLSTLLGQPPEYFYGITTQTSNVSPAEMPQKRVPIIGPVSAGAGCEVIDNEAVYPTVYADTKDPNAYAVIVEGESMEPVYKHGDILIVEPNRQTQTGDLVIAKATDGTVYFKLFQRAGKNAEVIRLVSLNPLFSAMEFEGQGLEWCHPVTSMVRVFKYEATKTY